MGIYDAHMPPLLNKNAAGRRRPKGPEKTADIWREFERQDFINRLYWDSQAKPERATRRGRRVEDG